MGEFVFMDVRCYNHENGIFLKEYQVNVFCERGIRK